MAAQPAAFSGNGMAVGLGMLGEEGSGLCRDAAWQCFLPPSACEGLERGNVPVLLCPRGFLLGPSSRDGL